MPSEEAFHRHLKIAFYLLVILALGFAAVKLFFSLLLPFTAAAGAALLFRPLIKKINEKTGISRRFLSVAVLLLLMSACALGLFFLAARLFSELKEFFLFLYNNADSALASFFDKIAALQEKLPLGNADAESGIPSLISRALDALLARLSAQSAAAAADFAARLPSALLSLFFFVLAVFFFSLDYDRITAYVRSLLSKKTGQRLDRWHKEALGVLKSYCKAYFLLFLLTFAELYLAFSLLNVDFALALAVITALLDILPAIGVGIVLIPWAVGLFLLGNVKRALLLLAIYGAITLIREIVEPHILGAHLGIHPLAALAAAYLGFRLGGLWGLLLAPFAALLLARLLAQHRRRMAKAEGEEKPDLPDAEKTQAPPDR